MSHAIEPYRRVLMPTDLQVGTESAYAHALRLALARAGDLHVVHVHTPEQLPDWAHLPSAREMLVRWGKLSVHDGVKAFGKLGLTVRFSALPSLELEDPIARTVAQEAPDLLVLATHAREGVARLREASIAESLARHSPGPALFLPRTAQPFVDLGSGSVSLRRIVVPVHTLDDGHLALREAQRLVVSYDAAPTEFVLVHVGSRETMPALMLADDDARWSYRTDVRSGAVVDEVVQSVLAHDADVVVMTTHGHDSLWDWLAGSTTERIVHEAKVPVLAVPMH